jgi:hypothetical protein
MESYIHSKVYPVSIGLAVDDRYKKIIDIQVASIKLKGQLQIKIAKQGVVPLKIQNRPNNSPQMRIEVIKNVRKALRPDGVIFSDEKPAYITLIKKGLPASVRHIGEKSRVALKLHPDPQALGRFNAVCVHLRNYVSRLGRRSLITSKNEKMLSLHLYMILARYNEYSLSEILKQEQFKETAFEREWELRKARKKLKVWIAYWFYWKQKLRDQVKANSLPKAS